MSRERYKLIPAVYLVLIENNKILLSRRFNTGYEDGNYSLVAGHLDAGENFFESMIREAKEEANIILNKKNLEIVHLIQRSKLDRFDIYIRPKYWEGEIQNLEPDKCDDLSWFDINRLPDNTIPDVKQAIENIQNNNLYSVFE